MSRSPSSSALLPLPGSPGSSWPMYRARLKALFHGADATVVVSFWLFGLINNVLYVIILSAAQDLVGSSVPKSVVLLADVLPSFFTKLIAPYFIHHISYSIRILIFCALSSAGMLLIAFTPDTQTGGSISIKMFGVVMASLSSGGGELSFLGLTHYYGPFSLAAWGSGTGGAGLVGAGLYVLLTSTIGLSVRTSLISSAFLPAIMLLSFFVVLPRGPLRLSHSSKLYDEVPTDDADNEDILSPEINNTTVASSLLVPGPSDATQAYQSTFRRPSSSSASFASFSSPTLAQNLRRARALFVPYMLPLLLVYIAEYTINQSIAPTLLYPLPSSPNAPNHTPFTSYRQFYPFYMLLYQLGVFVSRSSIPLVRLHSLYPPSLLQVGNFILLLAQSLSPFIPIYLLFIIIFWEGLLGGAVYVNTFAEIMDNVPEADREFSLGATSVSDSGGICIAGLIGLVLEEALCNFQVRNGRPFCRQV